MKHIIRLTPAILLSILALTACGGGNNKDAIASKYQEFINGASSVSYNVDTELSLKSTIYGEDFNMSWDSTDKMIRILSTGDFSAERKIKAKALENDYEESLTNYIVAGERYTTYDGSAFFKTSYDADASLNKGIVSIMDQIVVSDQTAVNSGTQEINGVKCLTETGTLKGAYLPYLFDKVNMTGLIDFKTLTDKEITMEYMLYLNEKTKQPVSLCLRLSDVNGILTDVISGMKNESTTINTDVSDFLVTYDFNEYNTVSAIELPEGANSAVEQANIDDMSISATGTDKLDVEKSRNVNVGGFSFKVSDQWEPKDALLEGYDGEASDGNKYKPTRLGYSQSEAKIDIMNPVNVSLLVDELTKSGVDTTSCVNTTEGDEAVTYNLDNVASLEVDYLNAQGYAADYLDDGKVKYIMGAKGDTKKTYKIIAFGGDDFLDVTFTTDGSELYKDYYDKTLQSMIESLDYKEVQKVEITIDETSQAAENTETEAETTEAAVEELRGTVKNPYESREQVEMKGIDLMSGNVVNEYVVVNSINTDEIIVGQKLKQAGLNITNKAGIVNMTVTTDKVKYTDDSYVDLVMHVSLVDKDGKQVGSLLNDGSPINKEFADNIRFDGDNQSKKVTFAFEVTDDFDEDKDMLKITYNDPDLGDRSLYVKLK